MAVKTEAQQAVLAPHRMRQQLVKFRTMQINSLRGLLTEYGEVMGKDRAASDKAISAVLARVLDRLPAVLVDALREQWNGLTKLDEQIAVIERRLHRWMLENKAVKSTTEIPGVGVLTATAAVATMGQQAGVGEMRLLRPALSALGKWPVATVQPPHVPNGLGLEYIGLSPDRLLQIRATKTANALWSAMQMLHAGSPQNKPGITRQRTLPL